MESPEQWALVARLRAELARDDDKAPWAGIETDWQTLDISSDPYLKRDDDDAAPFVLPAIAFWVKEFDTYPPPEWLLALCEMFRRYERAAGALTLEEVFFGRPRQRKGTYASREAKRDTFSDLHFLFAVLKGRQDGMSDAKAAEAEHARLVDGKVPNVPDSETMLKRLRRRGFKKQRTKKE